MCKPDPNAHATFGGINFGKWGYRLFMVCLSGLAVVEVVVLYKLIF